MPATSRGATLLGPDKLEIREYPIPDIPADGGLVKIELGGVCGSDVKYLHGGKAQLPYPLILGHEILGRVEKLGTQAAAIHGIFRYKTWSRTNFHLKRPKSASAPSAARSPGFTR
jgi:D-arabinose 1-dehydrogenase-like Zn-dependent alcohol dehydrogenase